MGTTIQTDRTNPHDAPGEGADPFLSSQTSHPASDLRTSWLTEPYRPSSRVGWPLVVCGGLTAGILWGINARLWMRYVSTDPEFTWGGTIFIILGFAVVGMSQAIAFLARRRITTRGRLTAVRVGTFAGLLPIFVGAGALLAPTVLLGAVTASHRSWPAWLRVSAGLGAAVPVAAVSVSVFDDFSILYASAAIVWLVLIYSAIIWAAQATLAPQMDEWRPPMPLRLLGYTCVLLLLVVAGLTLFVGF